MSRHAKRDASSVSAAQPLIAHLGVLHEKDDVERIVLDAVHRRSHHAPRDVAPREA
jgi:hypothetical protein